MEVHHHPEVPHGKKKHFKEYFLEFLMIFLAVTMGFIAENIREHLSDNSKEHEYISGMVKNLAVDTTILKITINRCQTHVSGLDTLRSITKSKLTYIAVQDSLYLFTNRYLYDLIEFKNDDVTLSQLRNAGGYSLIRNEAVVDSIAYFEKIMQYVNEQAAYYANSDARCIETSTVIFDLNAERKFNSATTSTPILLTTDRAKIDEFYNRCYFTSVTLNSYNRMLKNHLQYCKRLIVFLKKEYHLGNA